MVKWKYRRPYVPTAEELQSLGSSKLKMSIRLDAVSIQELNNLQLLQSKDRSEIIRQAISFYAESEKQKRITADLELKQKTETAQRDSKGPKIEDAYMRRLLFGTSDTQGWTSV